MACLYLRKLKNGSKIWYLKWYENGIPRQMSTGKRSKSDANEFFRNWNGQGNNRYSIEKLEGLIMDDIDVNNYSRKTKEIYQTVFNDLKTLFPNKKITSFTLNDINTYKKHRKATNSSTTVNIYLRTLRAIFQKALNHKLLTSDKIPPIEQLPVNEDSFNVATNSFEPTQKSYTVEQFSKLLSHILNNPGFFVDMNYQINFLEFCLTSFYTGCRRNEVLDILLKNINIENQIIPVVQTKKRGRKRVKQIPIHPFLWETVIYKRFYDENGNKRGVDPAERLIPLKPDYVTHKVKDCNRALGYPESLKLHSIRHTYGTELERAGVDKFNLKDLLGHSSLSTTEYYVHINTQQLIESNSRLPVLDYRNKL